MRKGWWVGKDWHLWGTTDVIQSSRRPLVVADAAIPAPTQYAAVWCNLHKIDCRFLMLCPKLRDQLELQGCHTCKCKSLRTCFTSCMTMDDAQGLCACLPMQQLLASCKVAAGSER